MVVMSSLKLFQVLVGATPPGRHIEQHDIYFGIAQNIQEIVPQIEQFWPEAAGHFHLDGYIEMNSIDNYQIVIEEKSAHKIEDAVQLFFINLGGYKPGEFEEYHYKMVIAASSKAEAISKSKATAFYKHTGFKGAESHIDDQYGIDVDDIYKIADILPAHQKEKYCLKLVTNDAPISNEVNIGYFSLKKLLK
jgi:hypothetical protein